MFEPNYHITAKLLEHVRRSGVLLAELRHRPLSGVVRMDFVQEARALSAHTSTRIEGNPLPLTEVRRLLKSRPQELKAAQREVMNYNEALGYLYDKIGQGDGQITLYTLLQIHALVMNGLEEEEMVGRFRQEPVVVNDPRRGVPVFWPPDHKDVQRLVDDLLAFAKEKTGRLDPLIVAGLFHRQFVLVHPFLDGNGRTARLATKLLLAELGVDTFPLFSFENFYSRDITRYFQFVGAVGDYYDVVKEMDHTEWLEYFSEGVVDELARVLRELELSGQRFESRLSPWHHAILDHIRAHGYITDPDYAAITSRAKATRALDFRRLLDLGLIERHGKGRATHYRQPGT